MKKTVCVADVIGYLCKVFHILFHRVSSVVFIPYKTLKTISFTY